MKYAMNGGVKMSEPIRVLHVVVNMNRGGAETLIMNLYRNIDKSKIQFDFLTCKKGVFDEEIIQLGGRVYRIPYVSDIGHFKYLKELKHFFKTHSNYKIVHSHLDKMSGFVLTAAKKAGIEVRIAHSHNTKNEGGILANIYKNYAGRFIQRSASHLLACSKSAANWLFNEDVQDVLIVNNGIELERFQYSSIVRQKKRSELGIDNNQFIIGHIGRFNHQKNHDFIIEVFYEYVKLDSNSLLILVGDGSLRSSIQSKIEKYKLTEKVKLLGVRDDVEYLYQTFDLFIFPSFHEGLPLTLIEAQGSGLPCLISEHITEEVDLGLHLIKRLSIENKDYWVKEIQKKSNESKKRHMSQRLIKEKGYDIKETSKLIENYYLRLVR